MLEVRKAEVGGFDMKLFEELEMARDKHAQDHTLRTSFEAGVASAFESEHVKALVEALKTIEDHELSGKSFGRERRIAEEALTKWEKRT